LKAQRPAPEVDAARPASGAQTGGPLAVLDASPNPILAVDSEARITYVNPQVEIAFGYRRGELIGQPIEKLLPEDRAARHVAQRDRFLSNPAARATGIGLDLVGRR
jgi:PAS domain-containing protein